MRNIFIIPKKERENKREMLSSCDLHGKNDKFAVYTNVYYNKFSGWNNKIWIAKRDCTLVAYGWTYDGAHSEAASELSIGRLADKVCRKLGIKV